jgi:XTP/dITP diphosphohydrolase
MVFRHPHVFGGGPSEGMTEEEVAKNWELIKTREKGGNRTILGGVPKSFPPVRKAYAMQDKARSVGFDWEEPQQVWDKVMEEYGEAREAVEEADPAHKEEEFGDLLFAVVNAARLYDVDPTVALDKACEKFRRRFTYLEQQTIARGRDLKQMSLAEMDAIWDEGKAKGL